MFAETDRPPRTVTLPAPMSARPATFGEGLLIPCANGLLYWIDPRTGKELADPYVGPYVQGKPVPIGSALPIGKREVAVVVGSILLKLAVDDNSFPHFVEVARCDFGEKSVGNVAIAGKRLFLNLGDDLITLPVDEFRLERPIADLLANAFRVPGASRRGLTAMNDGVVVLDDAETMETVVQTDGKLTSKWKLKLPATPTDDPFVHDGMIWLTFPDGYARAYSSKDGQPVKELSAGRAILDGPWLLGDRWIVLTPDGSIATLFPSTAGRILRWAEFLSIQSSLVLLCVTVSTHSVLSRRLSRTFRFGSSPLLIAWN
ncbi:MAG: hypothetical protein U1D30_25480 [Planctomycetota bacterium]